MEQNASTNVQPKSEAKTLTKPLTLDAKVAAFKRACEELEKAAKLLYREDKRTIDDSETKFIIIRAVRAEHLAREVKTGKSQRS